MSDLLVAAAALEGLAPSPEPQVFIGKQDGFVETVLCVDDMEIAAAAAESCLLKVESPLKEDGKKGSLGEDDLDLSGDSGKDEGGGDEDGDADGSSEEGSEVNEHDEDADLNTDITDESEAESAHCQLEPIREMKEMLEKTPEALPVDVGLQLPDLDEMDTIVVDESDHLDPAGVIESVVEGMVVVKAHELSRPLEIGSVLSLACRTPIGRVQDIFGPVTSPFYVVQLYEKEAKVDFFKPGALVFSVAKLAKYIIPDDLNQPDVRDERDEECDADLSDEEDEELKKADPKMPPLIGGHAFLKERRRMRKAKRQPQSKGQPRSMSFTSISGDSKGKNTSRAAGSAQSGAYGSTQIKVSSVPQHSEDPDEPPPPLKIPPPVFSSPHIQERHISQPQGPCGWNLHVPPIQQHLGNCPVCPDCSRGPPMWMASPPQPWKGHHQYVLPSESNGPPTGMCNSQPQFQQHPMGQGIHPQYDAGYRPFSGHSRPRALPGFNGSEVYQNQWSGYGDGPPPGLQ